MFIELLKCRKCERYSIHRILDAAELPAGLVEKARLLAGGRWEHCSFTICSICQIWTLHAETTFDPDAENRARFDVLLR
jgi:hypothetical protein